jgi:hypothetical protein
METNKHIMESEAAAGKDYDIITRDRLLSKDISLPIWW